VITLKEDPRAKRKSVSIHQKPKGKRRFVPDAEGPRINTPKKTGLSEKKRRKPGEVKRLRSAPSGQKDGSTCST